MGSSNGMLAALLGTLLIVAATVRATPAAQSPQSQLARLDSMSGVTMGEDRERSVVARPEHVRGSFSWYHPPSVAYADERFIPLARDNRPDDTLYFVRGLRVSSGSSPQRKDVPRYAESPSSMRLFDTLSGTGFGSTKRLDSMAGYTIGAFKRAAKAYAASSARHPSVVGGA